MDVPVMWFADQPELVDIGDSLVEEHLIHVMDLTMLRRRVTARIDAVAIAGDYSETLRGSGIAARVPELEYLTGHRGERVVQIGFYEIEQR